MNNQPSITAESLRELWRPVVGYEGLYEVSCFGNVRSLDRTVTAKNGRKLFKKGCTLKSVATEDGYLRISPSKNGKETNKRVHRLVAEAWIPNPDNLMEVNHLDLNKTNNYIENLEWCTSSENSVHAFAVRDGATYIKGMKYGKTHCVHGHEFTEENSHYHPRWGRSCNECRRNKLRRFRARAKQLKALAPKSELTTEKDKT